MIDLETDFAFERFTGQYVVEFRVGSGVLETGLAPDRRPLGGGSVQVCFDVSGWCKSVVKGVK